MERVLGWTPEELIDLNAYDFVHPDDRATLRTAHGEVVARGAARIVTYRFRTKTRGWVRVEAVLSPLARGVEPAELHLTVREAGPRVDAEVLLGRCVGLPRALADLLPGAYLLLIDHQLRVVSAEGEATGELARIDAAAIRGRTLDDLPGQVPDPVLAGARERCQAALDGREEEEEVRADGWTLEIRAGPVRDNDGVVVAALVVLRDVSTRTEAIEHARRRGHLLDAVDAAVVEIDLKGLVRSWNRAAEKLYGWTESEAVGAPAPAEILAPEGTAAWAETLARLRAGETSEGVRDLEAKNGSRISVFARTHMYFHPGGEPAGLIAISVDATARLRQQAAVVRLGHLALTEPDLRSLRNEVVATLMETLDVDLVDLLELRDDQQTLEMVADVGIRRDQDQKVVVDREPGSRAVFVLEREHQVIIDDLPRESRFRPDQQLVDAGAVSGMVVVVEGRGAPYGTLGVHTRTHRRFTANDLDFLTAVANLLAAAIQRSHAEGTNQALQRRLAQSERLESLGRLTGGIAHDFNNMLSLILGFAEFVEEELQGHPARDDVTRIRRAAERAAALTSQLLMFAQTEPTQVEVIEVNPLLERLAPLLRRSLGQGIALELKLDSDLRPVEADATKLEQVIVNLIVNASDAMPEGGPIRIATSNEQREHEGATVELVRIAVEDSGEGMSEELQAQVFDPFFTTKGGGKGTGLGLATSYGVISQLGGTIELSSSLGAGTTMTVVIPATDRPVTARGAAPEKEVLPTNTGHRILLAEDELGIRDLIARTLASHGYAVVDTGSALDALALGKTTDYDLLITDIAMPDMSGPALARALTAGRPSLRVIFISGHRDRSEQLPASARYLAKPFKRDDLLRCVASALGTG